ncbi:hypothetical protein [Streptomyces sp. WZ.A104]|uniref:hypothetical protein n=1 Tax=Streptomyces sp. WZ.A104 TaxID=2023771 RepID=UPI0011804B2C|nr:hypothetical protein [Streptomyces sp. WZ.A104]
MAKALQKPGLPPGALRELNEALHQLHLLAGWPSCPDMARMSSSGSKSTIHAAFRKPDLPALTVVRALAYELAGLAGRDRDEEVHRFHELWISAAREYSVAGGGEEQPSQTAPGGVPAGAREPHDGDGSWALLHRRGSPQVDSDALTAASELDSAAWLNVIELAISAVLLSLFPVKTKAYEFLRNAKLPEEIYVAGAPDSIDYWVGIVGHVRSDSSLEGLMGLIESAEAVCGGGPRELQMLLGALSDAPGD